MEEQYEKLREIDQGDFTPRGKAALRFVADFTADPMGMERADFADLLGHFTAAEAIEIAAFTAWQANGLRAIHSWDADVLFRSPEVELAYADGPSLFVKRPPGQALPSAEPYPRPEDIVPYPNPRNPWEPRALGALRGTWREWGCPSEEWLDYLAVAPHVLWGWAEFHRLTFAEGLLPRRTKALAIALLASRIGHDAWVRGVMAAAGPWRVTEGEAADLQRGNFSAFESKTAACLTYVDRLESGYLTIDDAFFQDIARALTPGEIVELGMMAGMHMGSIRLSRLVSSHAGMLESRDR